MRMQMQMRMRMKMYNIMYVNESNRAAILAFSSGDSAAHIKHALPAPWRIRMRFGTLECDHRIHYVNITAALCVSPFFHN